MIDGVVRPPSAFSITLTCLPSITATQELVVPRSMPIIFPICSSPSLRSVVNKRSFIVMCWRPRTFWLTDGHQRRTQHASLNQIAFLEHADDRVRRWVSRHGSSRLMPVRLKFFTRWMKHAHSSADKGRVQLPQRECNAFA